METAEILILSTAHLHPLEANVIDKVSMFSSTFANLVAIDVTSASKTVYDIKRLPMLFELMLEINQKYPQFNYILFDADATKLSEEFRVYNW